MKNITAFLCALTLLGGAVAVRAGTCCENAKKEGKGCAHRCCQ